MVEQNNSEKGIRNLRIFITADALLAAILMVWAQLWIQPSLQLWGRYYQPEYGNIGEWFNRFNESVGFGLAWTYFAVFLSLLALAWVGLKTLATSESKTPETAIGLFAASLVMGLVDVSQSFFSVTFKIVRGGLIYESLGFEELKWFLFLIIFIVGLSHWGARWLKRDDKLKYLPWCLEIIILVFAAGIALGFILCRQF